MYPDCPHMASLLTALGYCHGFGFHCWQCAVLTGADCSLVLPSAGIQVDKYCPHHGLHFLSFSAFCLFPPLSFRCFFFCFFFNDFSHRAAVELGLSLFPFSPLTLTALRWPTNVSEEGEEKPEAAAAAATLQSCGLKQPASDGRHGSWGGEEEGEKKNP